MIRPSPETDAAPPERGARGIVFLAGAIKYWWLRRCMACQVMETFEGSLPDGCPVHGRETMRELWGTPEHQVYVDWRNAVRAALVGAGYLTYAPHEAFKGTWDDRAQAVNDAAIAAADVMLVLSPEGVWTPGTDEEADYARRVGTPVIYAPPGSGRGWLLEAIAARAG